MAEQDPFIFNDERYAAVGDLVIRAAGQARAELEAVERELFASTVAGHATMKALEERKALAESDAAALGAMAAHIDPAYAPPAEKQNGTVIRTLRAGSRIDSRAEASVPGDSNDAGGEKRTGRRAAQAQEKFEERASRYVRFMVSQGAVIEEQGGVSPRQVIRAGLDMSNSNWGNFSGSLVKKGLLTYHRDPLTKDIIKASMERERIAGLIESGDLPPDLEEELAKLDDHTEPEDEPEIDDPNSIDDRFKDGSVTQIPIIDKRMRDHLSQTHTRYSGAARHRQAKKQ